jgi:hypothetical protein
MQKTPQLVINRSLPDAVAVSLANTVWVQETWKIIHLHAVLLYITFVELGYFSQYSDWAMGWTTWV